MLVTVYVERPRKKASTNHHHHHHHHHYLHHTTKREVTQVNHGASGPGKGYDRRAQLLQYSKRLRESSRSATITPLPLEPTSSSNHNQQPSTQVQPCILYLLYILSLAFLSKLLFVCVFFCQFYLCTQLLQFISKTNLKFSTSTTNPK